MCSTACYRDPSLFVAASIYGAFYEQFWVGSLLDSYTMFAFLSVFPMQFHNGHPGDRREVRVEVGVRVRVRFSDNPNITPTLTLKQYSKKIDPDPDPGFY